MAAYFGHKKSVIRRSRRAQAILESMGHEGIEKRALPGSIVPGEGSILAIDYGRVRMGLALADTETRMARPLSTLDRVNRNEDMRRLRELVREHKVKQIVIGLPLRLDGTHGEMAEEAERFAQRVRKQIGVPVEMVDERLTSWEAERLLEEVQGRFIHEEKLTGSKKSKSVQAKMSVDAVAAAVILKEYLDHQEQTAGKT
jgi:putative Holliday junction resolvase